MALKRNIYLIWLMLFMIPNGLLLGYMFFHSFDLYITFAMIVSVVMLLVLLVTIQQVFKKGEDNQPKPVDLPLELAEDHKNEKSLHDIREPYLTLQKMHSDMQQAKDLAGNVAKGANRQAQNVEKSTDSMIEISQGIEQIANSAQSVANTSKTTDEAAMKGFESVGVVIGQMESIGQSVNNLSIVITDLAKHSSEIGQIVETITDISNQTNLLALNAAIEAARAGEHGKGFAVVAAEVRKLSEEVKHSSQQITSIVSSIQDNVKQSVNVMEEGKEKVTSGITVVNEVKQTFELIQNQIREVANQIMEVSAAVQQLSAGSEEISNITEYTKKVQLSGVNMIEELYTSIKAILEDMEKVLQEPVTAQALSKSVKLSS